MEAGSVNVETGIGYTVRLNVLVSVHPFELTMSEMFATPELFQLNSYGPEPLPETTFAEPKSQV
jgi:hypothetical protein